MKRDGKGMEKKKQEEEETIDCTPPARDGRKCPEEVMAGDVGWVV